MLLGGDQPFYGVIGWCKQKTKRQRGKIQEFWKDLLFASFNGKDGTAPLQYAHAIGEEVDPLM
jgi:hypothetical protein